MPTIFYSLAVLACPVGMGLMMWMMMRGGKQSPQDSSAPQDSAAELARLRTEIEELRAAQAQTPTANSETAAPR